MRGGDCGQGSMFSYVSLETRIPQDHPLRPMRTMVDAVSAEVLRQGRAGIRTMIPETRRSISAARLSRKKGQTSHLAYMGHLLTENRNGLIVSAMLTEANDHAERLVGLEMIEEVARARRITLGADRGFDTEDFVAGCRQRNVTPHVAQNTTKRASRIDRRAVRQEGYEVSQPKRKRIEESFGWMKTIGGMRKTRHRGTDRVGWRFIFTAAVYDLVRIRNLQEAQT